MRWISDEIDDSFGVSLREEEPLFWCCVSSTVKHWIIDSPSGVAVAERRNVPEGGVIGWLGGVKDETAGNDTARICDSFTSYHPKGRSAWAYGLFCVTLRLLPELLPPLPLPWLLDDDVDATERLEPVDWERCSGGRVKEMVLLLLITSRLL